MNDNTNPETMDQDIADSPLLLLLGKQPEDMTLDELREYTAELRQVAASSQSVKAAMSAPKKKSVSNKQSNEEFLDSILNS